MIDRIKAISKLELMRCNSEWNKDFNKALDLAIKVLRRTESDDCISRQALIDEILEDGNGAVLSYPTGMYEDDLVERIEEQMIQHFIGVIEYAPPVEPKRPKGEWVNDTRYSGWTCTHCNHHDGNKTDNYCPNCGAKMKGGNE